MKLVARGVLVLGTYDSPLIDCGQAIFGSLRECSHILEAIHPRPEWGR